MTKFEHLQRGILALSNSGDWERASSEWTLQTIYFAPVAQTCLCTHSPIKEICVLVNSRTAATTEVGNCCVKRFLGLPSASIFASIKRIEKDITKALGEEAIELFHSKQWLSDFEARFARDTASKRTLSAKQANLRQRINTNLLTRLKNQHR